MAENSRNDFMSRISGNGEYRKPQYSQANKSSMQKRASSSAGEARERSLHGQHTLQGKQPVPDEIAEPEQEQRHVALMLEETVEQ